MKKLISVLAVLAVAVPAYANDFYGDDDYEYIAPAPGAAPTRSVRDNYVGLRLHKNEHISFRHRSDTGPNTTIRADNIGFGAYVGNRLTNHVKIEFETAYTGARDTKYSTTFDTDIWANMLNLYLYQAFGNAVEPYAGMGVGLAGIWSSAGGNRASECALSWAAMAGVNFALNDRVDLNLGLKYQYYGTVEHDLGGDKYATTKIDATELYIGAAYKFGLK